LFEKNDLVFSFPGHLDIRILRLSAFSSASSVVARGVDSFRTFSLFLWMPVFAISVDVGSDILHGNSERPFLDSAVKDASRFPSRDLDSDLPGTGIDHARP
jgi:hypothetical protein